MQQSDNFAPLFAIFDNAAKHIHWPKIRLEHAGVIIRLDRCGSKSRSPGAINIKIGDTWIGRIERDGNVYGYGRSILRLQDSPAPYYDACMHVLRFAANPAQQAAIHGHEHNYCCFCARELTNAVSVQLGYGPICADKYGLPHSVEHLHDNVTAESMDRALNNNLSELL